MQLDLYKKQQTMVKERLQQLKSLACELRMDNADSNVSNTLKKIDTETFNLVIVGEFSRGKSTFVNALLGRRILPASKNPTTAVISKIVYGEEPAFKIFYKDGETPQTMDEKDFIKLTAPPEPDESDEFSVKEYAEAQQKLSSIDYAKISYPLSFCRDGVEVVDTPGTNDLNVGRMEITFGYLRQADAVVLLLAAYQPLTASEAQFLKETIVGDNHIQDIFFVISHKDDLDNAEQEQDVIEFIAKNLREVLPEGITMKKRIFLVNSLGALYARRQAQGEELSPKQQLKVPENFSDTGFPMLEDRLGRFLAEEKGWARLKKYNKEAQMIIHTMQHDLDVRIGVVSHSADEIRQKVSEMKPAFIKAKNNATRIISDMRLNLDGAGSDIDYRCHMASNVILDKAKNAVSMLTQDMSTFAMQQMIEKEVTYEKKYFVDTTLKDWQNTIEQENAKVQQKLSRIWNDIDIEYQNNLNLPMAIDEAQDALSLSNISTGKSFSEQAYDEADKMFYEMFANNKDVGERILNGLGAALASTAGVVADIWSALTGKKNDSWRDKVRLQVISTYSSQGERMAKSLKKQFTSLVDGFCKNIKQDVDDRLDDMERQLQDIIEEKETKEQDAEREKAYLLGKKDELRKISRDLHELVEG